MKFEKVTRSDRREQGKLLRDVCSRLDHGTWKTRSSKNDIIKLLEESNKDRIKGLIPVRYGRMSESPFHFYRGSAIIQARDLFNAPSPGIIAQVCGDCHLSNFGGFATPERSLAFDINDFDETFPAPWEWDMKRLVASLVVAARYLDFGDSTGKEAVRSCVRSYRERIDQYSKGTVLETWYARITIDDIIATVKGDKDLLSRLGKKKVEAGSRTSESVFPKLTTVVDGTPRIIDNPPLIYHFQDQVKDLDKLRAEIITSYRASLISDRRELFDRYQPVDSAIKVVGVGSVGTRCFVTLLLADNDDPLFLQIKEARRSVLEKPQGKSRYAHQGERIVSGQRLMQAATDIFIGWTSDDNGRQYYVRQLRDQKVSAELESMKKKTLIAYAGLCGWALARAHAKGGDAATIAGYVGMSERLDDGMVGYALAYADQVERDYASFKKAIRSGRLRTDSSNMMGQQFNL
ncbi:MAG TPA: DUF2252 domain-containing protein [Candidatus Didemnitutus sp.]|nr:DUF2252 domain-containing protein [Candidatus Didemnitutus sp.]